MQDLIEKLKLNNIPYKYYEDNNILLINADNKIALDLMEEGSIGSIVSDPPYGLSFMGKKWDYDVPDIELWQKVYRVCKPGANLLSFGGTRTYHRMVCNIEDGGFEIRDSLSYLYGSGFPKSLSIGKAIDKLQGNEREFLDKGKSGKTALFQEQGGMGKFNITKGNSQWEGWGTGLKPAMELISLSRKPIAEKNIALNVLKYGVGGINVDKSRINHNNENLSRPNNNINENNVFNSSNSGYKTRGNPNNISDQLGRFPSNIILEKSDCVLEEFSKYGETKSDNHKRINDTSIFLNGGTSSGHNDSGSVARYFKQIEPEVPFYYCAKASQREKNAGCEDLEEKNKNNRKDGGKSVIEKSNSTSKNIHPTCKPISLMEYLVNMVNPPAEIVLDMYMGSGSTGVACVNSGFGFIGIEMEEEYFQIACKRIEFAIKEHNKNNQQLEFDI